MESGNDQFIIDKWQSWHERLSRGELDHWKEDHYGRLAYCIMLDNLSRNMFRGTGRAFATDELAYQMAKTVIEDKQMFSRYRFREREFLMIVFMHREEVAVVEKCIEITH